MSVTEYNYHDTTASKRVFYTIDGSTDGTVKREEKLGHEHSISHNVNSLWIAHANVEKYTRGLQAGHEYYSETLLKDPTDFTFC